MIREFGSDRYDMNAWSTDRLERGTSLSPSAVWLRMVLSLGGRFLPNQGAAANPAGASQLQATRLVSRVAELDR